MTKAEALDQAVRIIGASGAHERNIRNESHPDVVNIPVPAERGGIMRELHEWGLYPPLYADTRLIIATDEDGNSTIWQQVR